MDCYLNLAIFLFTCLAVAMFFRRDGHWSVERGLKSLRYFTVESNILCGVSALLMVIDHTNDGFWMLKYISTAAVTVTMLTVILFLGPTQGYKKHYRGADFFMHLLTPFLAIISFTLFERRGLTLSQALWGMLPQLLYGILYLYKTILAPPDRRWKDFYGFNKNGAWPLSFLAMMVGGFAVCMGLMALNNLP